MAAGLLTVAHRSGGPLTDIIVPAANASFTQMSTPVNGPPAVGFLVSTVSEYGDKLFHIFEVMKPADRDAMSVAARNRAVEFFSEDAFSAGWLKFFTKLGL